MNIVLSLLSAFSAGTSDFLGGLASRRAPAVVVTMYSQAMGFVVAVAIAAAAGGEPTTADLWWGALGGLGGAAGLLSIYAGYASARVAIAAPVAGVGAAAIPVLFDVATGDDLTATAGVGVVLGLVAIALVSMGRSDAQGTVRQSLLYGLGGAFGLAFLLLCVGQASDDGGVWTVAPTRLPGCLVLLIGVLMRGAPRRFPRVVWHQWVGIGVLGTGANALFGADTRLGALSTAAVLVSMFPAVTVLWALAVFGEKLRPLQVVGLGVALLAVGLLAAG